MDCEHDFVKTDMCYYTCPLQRVYRCTRCGYQITREEGEGIKVVEGVEAVRLRPAMYELTQEDVDKMTDDAIRAFLEKMI